jgi:hypothetical protein
MQLTSALIKHQYRQKLYLGLRNNKINPGGAFQLSRLTQLVSLTSLDIDLHLGAGYVANTNYGKTACMLHLGLEDTGIGDEGVDALRFSLSQYRDLCHLHLRLDRNVETWK